jgi:hypothetical protein
MLLFLPTLLVFFLSGKIIFFYIACILLIPTVFGDFVGIIFDGISFLFEAMGSLGGMVLFGIGVMIVYFMMVPH